MKLPHLAILVTSLFFFASCDKKPPTSPSAPEQAAASTPSTQSARPSATPPATPDPTPAVNVTKLNKDLLKAITFNQPEQALEAIKAGATSDAKNRHGLPVIFIAAQAGNPGVVKALIAAGADPNAKIGTSFNDDGVGYGGTTDGTVLGYAAAKGHGQVMADLVTAGAEVNGSGPDGTTPLMQAAAAGKYKIVKRLIDAGADPNAKNKHGGTALGVVQMIINPDAERQKIIELLKSKSQ